MFLPRQTGGDGNQQENNLEKVYRVLQQQLCQAIAEIYVEYRWAENNSQGIAKTTLVKNKLNKCSTTVPRWS
jgi:hypothetical protein